MTSRRVYLIEAYRRTTISSGAGSKPDWPTRAELVGDPVAALVGVGIPAATAEPLLQALAVPDEVLARLPEIVAHQHEQLPLKPRLLILLLGSSAVAEEIRFPKPGVS